MEEYECFHLFCTFLVTQIFGMVAFFLYGDCVFFVCFAKRILGNSMKLPDRHFRML